MAASRPALTVREITWNCYTPQVLVRVLSASRGSLHGATLGVDECMKLYQWATLVYLGIAGSRISELGLVVCVACVSEI